MTDMPIEILVLPTDKLCVGVTPHMEFMYTKYTRASELAKAYEAIVELADRIEKIDKVCAAANKDPSVSCKSRELFKYAALIQTAREQGK